MERSRGLPSDRPAVGQLLVRLLHEFRRELSEPMAERGYGDIRPPHLQIFGSIGWDGRRLTEIAARAELSLSATSELINDLEDLGYVARVPDAAVRVAEIERHWGGIVGHDRFDDACYLLSALLDELSPEER
jgi:hypothetical protein